MPIKRHNILRMRVEKGVCWMRFGAEQGSGKIKEKEKFDSPDGLFYPYEGYGKGAEGRHG
jgi:hypothetical protein